MLMLPRMATPFRKRGGRFKDAGRRSALESTDCGDHSAKTIIVVPTVAFAFLRKSVGAGRYLRPTGVLYPRRWLTQREVSLTRRCSTAHCGKFCASPSPI